MNATTASGPESSLAMTPKERMLAAISGQPLDRPPIWLMRQAGRYLPEYQAVKAEHSFHDLCRLPEVSAEVTLQPYRRYGMDALIVFNDILIPLETLGFSVEYGGGGPVVSPAIRSEADWKALHPREYDEAPPVVASLHEIQRQAGPDIPVLGFAGSPFTLATYMIEGSTTRNLRYIKTLMTDQPQLLHSMLEQITQSVIGYLRLQAQAGVVAVQIFDTWAGALSLHDYRQFALPYQQKIIDAIQGEGTPVILYVKQSAHVLAELAESDAAVLSIDWLTPLATARENVQPSQALQGNLDPSVLYASPEAVAQRTRDMLAGLPGKQGYIANLGHGILPETPVESVNAFVETVKNYDYDSIDATD